MEIYIFKYINLNFMAWKREFGIKNLNSGRKTSKNVKVNLRGGKEVEIRENELKPNKRERWHFYAILRAPILG